LDLVSMSSFFWLRPRTWHVPALLQCAITAARWI
jgi:hypothetical protein